MFFYMHTHFFSQHAQEGSIVLIMLFSISFSFKLSFVANSIHLLGESPEIPINKRSMSPVNSFEVYKAEKGSQWKGEVSKKRIENT